MVTSKPFQNVPLSIVIPSFNEVGNIESVIRDSIDVLCGLTDHYDIVVVDDQSQDGSYDLLIRLAQEIPELQVVRNPQNIGCHPSTLIGWPLAKGEYRFFIPGDRQILPSELPKFLAKTQEGCDVVYSWRTQRADPLHRLLISGSYNVLIRLLFGIRVHDVDSSVLLSRRAVEQVLPQVRSDSAFISVEILLESSRQGLKIGETVIEHHPRVYGKGIPMTLQGLGNVPMNLLKTLFWFWGQKLKK